VILFAVGISHHTAGVEQREKVSLTGGRACTLLQALRQEPTIVEAVALSTCNRTEVYATTSSSTLGDAAIARVLVETTRISRSELDEVKYRVVGTDAACHLLRVAASLDSMVIGESEIQGQVRAAIRLAEAHGMAGPVMRELFRRALITGKRVRRETAVGRGAASVSSVAVELAREATRDLAGRRALLIGAGHVAESTARALLGQGVAELTVANRSLLAAEELAERFSGRGAPLEALPGELSRADIAICSTDSATPILDVATARNALAHRPGKPLVVIDIAVPRDVEPAVRGVPGVTLRDIDDLERVVQGNVNGRLHEAWRAQCIVQQELEKLAPVASTLRNGRPRSAVHSEVPVAF
jgi:glutamyl-tRNA reductase